MKLLNIDIFTWVSAVLLAVALGAAVWFDVKYRRIPNKLVLAGTLAALALHTVLPDGTGFFSDHPGGLGFLNALAGLGVGFAVLLPMYLMRALGAGDVKLMAMIGAFLGPELILGAILTTFIAGGVLAIVAALWSGVMLQVLANVRFLLFHGVVQAMSGSKPEFDAPATTTGKLPYAIAIAAGTVSHIVLVHNGIGPFAS
jgi:prepilin peptidase CpaA